MLEEVRRIISNYPGTVPVSICLLFPAGEKVLLEAGRQFRVSGAEEMIREIESRVGEQGVYVAVDPSPCKRRSRRPGGRRPAYADSS
jgi:hypothetical protein